MIKNEQLMNAIGGEQGYSIYYSGDEVDDKTGKGKFRVSINGSCPNSMITISGLYREEEYTIIDTVIVRCK